LFSRIFLLIVGLALLLGGFQNCRFQSNEPTAAAKSNGGSGNGYDGKLFVYVAIDRICADESPIESSIEFRNGTPYLVREDCVNLPEAQWRAVSVVTDPADASYITYNGVIYVDALSRIQEAAIDRWGNTVVVGQLVPPDTILTWDAKWQHTYVAKLDPQDRLLWAYKIGGADSFEATNVVIREDGSVVIAGHGGAVHLVALSSDGQRLWNRVYSTTTGEVPFIDLVADLNGDLYLSAGIESLLKLDSSGELLWQREAVAGFGKLAIGPDQSIYSAANGLLKRLDGNGNLLWTTYADVNTAYNKLLIHADGSFAAAGMTGAYGDSLVAKFGADGQVAWVSILKHPGGHASSRSYHIAEGPSGYLISGSRLLNGMQDLRGVLYGVSLDGQAQWTLDHPSQLEGEIWLKEGALRVRADASFNEQSVLRQSFFLRLNLGGGAPTCTDCTVIPATVQNYAPFVSAGRPVNVSTKFSARSNSIELLKLNVKLEVRE
jgi:hypothetical protein